MIIAASADETLPDATDATSATPPLTAIIEVDHQRRIWKRLQDPLAAIIVCSLLMLPC